MPEDPFAFERARAYEITGDNLIAFAAAIATSVIATASRLSAPAKLALYEGFLANASFVEAALSAVASISHGDNPITDKPGVDPGDPLDVGPID